MSTIGDRIKEVRKLRGISAKKLGQLLGVSQSVIAKWETGARKNLRSDSVNRLAGALKVNTQWLLTGEGQMEKSENNSSDLHRGVNSGSYLRDLDVESLDSKAVGNRIREARESYPNITYGVDPVGISQAKLADNIKVDSSLISKWESGERVPGKEQFEPLANALGVKLRWLLSGEGKKDRFPVPPSKQLQPASGEMREVPILGYVPGSDPFAPGHEPEGSIMVPLEVSEHPGLFALYIRGDSMSPKIEDGDLVFIEPVEGELRTGSIVVALIQGETTCKIFKRTGSGKPMLVPLNPVVEPIYLTDDGDRILGVVAGSYRVFKPL